MNQALYFMKNLTASVEILQDDQIKKCFFKIPYVCQFLTKNIKEHVIFASDRNSDKERIKFFI